MNGSDTLVECAGKEVLGRLQAVWDSMTFGFNGPRSRLLCPDSIPTPAPSRRYLRSEAQTAHALSDTRISLLVQRLCGKCKSTLAGAGCERPRASAEGWVHFTNFKGVLFEAQTNQKTPWYGYVRLHVATILSHRFHGLGRRVSAS